MIVLDACRDNPFGWARSGSRGLSVVSRAPAGSIIMYATSANSTADDGGSGRNGLFTGQLLNNLKTPGLSVQEVFNKTGEGVIIASEGKQHPEIAIKFFTTAYLGSKPGPNQNPVQKLDYKIGDIGPAGGIIFYDKLEYTDGWRYLEAAPEDTEISNGQWGAYRHDVSGTQMGLGSGKRNTDIIVAFLNSVNESGKAAQLCKQLTFGGKNDWFLPSMEELNWMYLNLHRAGLGGFKNERYWSSSQVNTTNAWYRHFGSDGRASHDKDKNASGWVFGYVIRVRAIRAF